MILKKDKTNLNRLICGGGEKKNFFGSGHSDVF